MKIAVIGLGLIGGSLCKSLKSTTNHYVMGLDINQNTLTQALEIGSIDKVITEKELCHADICFVCLYPVLTVEFIKINISHFKKGAVITDVCGIKKYIADNVEKTAADNGLFYVGGHPMAGKEKSGFNASCGKLFQGASYILTKTPLTDQTAYDTISQLVKEIGCNIISSTTEIHDRVIAYTSQLAHIVSSSYVKSPSIQYEKGFTGGSFQDMTRVALLEENMWKDLFLLNRENLLKEIDIIINNLNDYRKSIYNNDHDTLLNLLKEGKEIKKNHIK